MPLKHPLESDSKVLDSDQSQDPKKRPTTLYDIPLDIIDLIIEKLDFRTQQILRKVSKRLRKQVDDQTPAFKSLSIYIEDYGVQLQFDHNDVTYRSSSHGACLVQYRYNPERLLYGIDPIDQAMIDLKSVLNLPKLKLNTLSVRITVTAMREAKRKAIFGKLRDTFSTNPTIDVEKLEIAVQNQDELVSILPYLTPQFLQKIDIQSSKLAKIRFPMTEIVNLDQWKNAKILKMQRLYFNWNDVFNLKNFNEITILLPQITVGQLKTLRDMLLQNASFITCTVRLDKPIVHSESIDFFLGDHIKLDPLIHPDRRYYTLPDTDESLLEMRSSTSHILFMRVTKAKTL